MAFRNILSVWHSFVFFGLVAVVDASVGSENYKPIHFKEFYEYFNWDPIKNTSQHGCAAELHAYWNQEPLYLDQKPESWYISDWTLEVLINCIYSQSTETTKLSLAAGSILLGLLPTVLAVVAFSTAEVGLLATKRPFLAFLLATASPPINPIRTYEYSNPVQILLIDEKKEGVELPLPRTWATKVCTSIFQYMVALACIVNAFSAIWELNYKAVYIVQPRWDFMLWVWVGIAVFIHALGIVSFRMRTHLHGHDGRRVGLRHWLKHELLPYKYQPPNVMSFDRESWTFVILVWFVYVFAVCNIMFGTFVLSSITFVRIVGSAQFAGRLSISVLFSRIILRWELSGMRQITVVNFRYASTNDEKQIDRLRPRQLEDPVQASHFGVGQLARQQATSTGDGNKRHPTATTVELINRHKKVAGDRV